MSEPTERTLLHSELTRAGEWRHLDARMLLVHPVNELVRFLPLIVGVFVLGRSNEGDPWHYLGVAVPIALGLWRFASTRFRITAGQIELRRGLVGRNVLTAPLDRVRTVELTASPIHRILGLTKVEVGTGSGSRDGENRLVLDSLGTAEGHRLRADLLNRAPAGSPPGPTPEAPPGPAVPPVADTVIMALDPSWVRFAPLTTSGIVIALAALGGGSQILGNAVERAASSSDIDERVKALPLALAIPAGLVVFVAIVSTLAIGGYLLANWGFVLSRDASGRSFHVRRGLLTTRETSIDVDRLRGLEIHEPLGLRLGGGGRLSAVVTGLRRSTSERTTLVPAAPRAIVVAVGEQVLDQHSLDQHSLDQHSLDRHSLGEAGPLTVALVAHGPAARRRRYLRALVPTALLPVVLLGLWVAGGWPLWPAVLALLAPTAGLWLARDRYAGLGHALTDRYLVVRSGSLQGRRDALQRSGIIGWNIKQTFFQRRAGLVTLTATTAAGKQAYQAFDVPEAVAVALADAAVPGLLGQFLRRPSGY